MAGELWFAPPSVDSRDSFSVQIQVVGVHLQHIEQPFVVVDTGITCRTKRASCHSQFEEIWPPKGMPL